MNNYTEIGNYYANSEISQSLQNAPFNHSFTMKIDYGNGTGYICQTYREIDTGRIAIRYNNQKVANADQWQPYVYFSDDDTAFRDVFTKNQQNNVDYNELTAGFHYCGTGCTNAPENYCRVLCLYSYNDPVGDSVQIAFSVISGNIYKRVYITGNWTAWYKFTGTSI